jgi:putative phosphoribosyl transferase
MMFANRAAAGKMLAEQLLHYKGEDPVILALPRGGVVLAAQVAAALSAPIDVLAVRRLTHPSAPEYGIGAIDEGGKVILNTIATGVLDRSWLLQEMENKLQEAVQRAAFYRGNRPPLSIEDKTVIIIDDGMATGLTMHLAVDAAREQKARRVIVAVPVAPAEPVTATKRLGAEVFVLQPPEEFAGAVGEHYVDFEQVSDTEVVKLLEWFVAQPTRG